jgi:Cation transporting ATPase, C-terminus
MKYVMMGISSNFGNMFSVAGAALFLPLFYTAPNALPMLPIQILLNNLLYTMSQTTIATDNVDDEYIERPKRWDISFIRNFMAVEGPISSIFDYTTFFTMILIFHAVLPVFQTAWFIESLTTQTLVVFVIRTRQSPFWKSRPGKYLTISIFAVIAAAIAIPYTPLGRVFQFQPPPPLFYVALLLMVVSYIFLAEYVKRLFYKRHAYRIEQVLVPKRKTLYVSANTRLALDIAAVVCLRQESEISLDSLVEDLKSLNFPADPDRVYQDLQYLRRAGLVEVDWHRRIIKRTAPIKEYMTKRVAASDIWSLIFDDWVKISRAIQQKYGQTNPDFQDLLTPKQR